MIAHDAWSLVTPKENHQLLAIPRKISKEVWSFFSFDIVRILRTEHVPSTAHPMLSEYHHQASLGECSLLWKVLRSDTLFWVILGSHRYLERAIIDYPHQSMIGALLKSELNLQISYKIWHISLRV